MHTNTQTHTYQIKDNTLCRNCLTPYPVFPAVTQESRRDKEIDRKIDRTSLLLLCGGVSKLCLLRPRGKPCISEFLISWMHLSTRTYWNTNTPANYAIWCQRWCSCVRNWLLLEQQRETEDRKEGETTSCEIDGNCGNFWTYERWMNETMGIRKRHAQSRMKRTSLHRTLGYIYNCAQA